MKLSIEKRLSLDPPVNHRKRVFASILPNGNGYSGVLREYTHGGPTELWRIGIDADGRQVEQGGLGISGEDPRAFFWFGRLMCLTWDYTPQSRPDYIHSLIDVWGGRSTRLTMSDPGDWHGKNWVPVVGGEELLIIRSLEPLWILKPDLATGCCKTIIGIEGVIGPHRGGGVATITGDRITGFGHRTENADVHTIFGYEIDMREWTVAFWHPDMPEGFNAGINDPTSAWPRHLVCCSTARSWVEDQPVEHFILRTE